MTGQDTPPAEAAASCLSSAALEVSGLRYSYPDGPEVLCGVDLSVRIGERVGLIGPNGTGKTTLFLAACGVLEPHAGTVQLFDTTITAGNFYPEIGVVFQNPDDQLFSPSVRDDVAFGPANMGLSADEVAARVREALSVTGTTELADRAPHHLSGGEKRMVSIAGVLAMHPRLVIYDEPTASLDIRARRRLVHFLQTSTQTMLLASHDLEFVLEVCDRVIVFDHGQAVTHGTPHTIMARQDLMDASGLETPPSLLARGE